MAKQTAVPTSDAGTILLLDPGVLLGDQNARFGLKQTRIDTLAEDIAKTGEVLNPLEIQKLEPAVNGHQYRITHGHYRHAAVSKLNSEGAGMKVPCRVVDPGDATQRLKRQLSENLERENLSPMDTAEAIKMALDLGISKGEVRSIFKRVGGRKGNVVQEASNSFVNECLSFLNFPKDIQTRIHDGRIRFGGAMALARTPKEKWQAILDRVEKERNDEVDIEEKAEAKLLEAATKQEDTQKKLAETQTALQKAKDAAAAARTDADKRAEEAGAAYKVAMAAKLEKDEKAKEKADKALKEAEGASREALKRVEVETKKAAKLEADAKKITLVSVDSARRMKEAKEKAAAKRGAPVTKKDVEKAAAKEGSGTVRLTLADARAAVSELQGEGVFPKVQLIGKAIMDCMDGKTTARQLINALSKITGEKK